MKRMALIGAALWVMGMWAMLASGLIESTRLLWIGTGVMTFGSLLMCVELVAAHFSKSALDTKRGRV